MAEEICIKTSGVTLASLLSENEQTGADQDGFLLGYTSEEVIKSVTDAEIEAIKIKKMLNITGIFPVPDVFFSSIGQVDCKHKIIEYIRDEKNVVGWYRSRKNTNLKVTLREKLIHKELCSIVDVPELFTFCALTSACTRSSATHTYSQVFYRYDYTQFVEVPLVISNLGDTNKLYKTASQKTGTIDRIIRNIRSDVNLSPDLSLNKIEDGVLAQVNALISQVTKQYEEKKSLEEETQLLKEQRSERHHSESDDALQELLSKTSEEIQEKLNFANAVKNKSPVVNKETKKALNAQLKMVPDSSSITKDIKNKQKAKTTPSSSNNVVRRTRAAKQRVQQPNNCKELNSSNAELQHMQEQED